MKNSKNSVSHGNTYPVYQATILFRANAIGTTTEQIWRRSRKQVEKPHGIAEIVDDRRANQSEEKKGAQWSAIFRPSKLRKHVNRIIFELASPH